MSWPVIALISLSVFWLGLLILLTKWPATKNKSISQHSASFRQTFIFFTAIQSIVGFTLYLFVIRWFIPTFHMSLLFTIVYTVTAWLQIISAFIPDKMIGRSSVIHQHLANAFAVGMLLTTLLLLLASTIHGWPKLLFYVVAAYMIYGMILISSKRGKPYLLPNYLMLQVIYIVAFQVAFLSVAFYK